MSSNPSPSSPNSHARWHHLAHAADAAPIGLILIGGDGRVRSINRQALALLNAAQNEIVQTPAEELFNTEDGAIRAALRDCIDHGRPYEGRVTLRLRGDRTVDCDAAIQPLPDNGGEAVHALWLNDVTAHVAIQQSLLQAERLSALGEIVAGVAHELNNPLTGILGYAQLLLNDTPSVKNRQRLENILNEAMRCQAIVQSLRGFSSRAVAEHAVHDLNELVDSMVTLLEYQMRVDGIEVVRRFADEAPTAFVDANGLGRAILNIVHNAHQALQFVEDRPRRFQAVTEADDNEIRLRFQDNGPGIDPEDLPRVFDPFFTTREFGRGVGLGLSVAYGIVREHGGAIDVASTPGESTEFIVRLPRAAGAN